MAPGGGTDLEIHFTGSFFVFYFKQRRAWVLPGSPGVRGVYDPSIARSSNDVIDKRGRSVEADASLVVLARSTTVNNAKRFLNALRLLVVLVSFHVMLAWVLCRYYSQYQRCVGDPSPFDSEMTCFFFRLEGKQRSVQAFPTLASTWCSAAAVCIALLTYSPSSRQYFDGSCSASRGNSRQ